MIEVLILMNDEPLAKIEIKNHGPDGITDFGDYTVKYLVERGGAIGAHKRTIYGFPRKYYNVFALVLQSLNALNEKDLKLERDFDPDEATVSADMARRFHRAVPAIQAKFSKLHCDRPSVWSRQPE